MERNARLRDPARVEFERVAPPVAFVVVGEACVRRVGEDERCPVSVGFPCE